jgi:hypothetical protein
MAEVLRNLKQSSITTYRKQISTILKQVYKKDYMKEDDVLMYFKNYEPFLKWLEGKALNTQISYITAVIVYMSPVKRNVALNGYSEIMSYYQTKLDLLFKEKDKIDLTKKTENEKENWVEWEELTQIFKLYKKKIKKKGYKIKEQILKNEDDFNLILKYVLVSLYVLHQPRRNVYASTKIISEKKYFNLKPMEKEHNNYLVIISRNNKFFSFGNYKTSKIYGVQKIKVKKELNSVLNFWLNFNKTEHLLINNKGKRITENSLTRYLNNAFSPTGKKISSQMLRKIYTTNKFPEDNYIQMKEEATAMGHSIHTQQTKYIKKK